MKIKHSLAKGRRINKGTIKTKDGRIPVFCSAKCNIDNMWWLEKSEKWGTLDEAVLNKENYSSNSMSIRSIKAFKRRLKEWSIYMPKGTEFVLQSNFCKIEVIGKI